MLQVSKSLAHPSSLACAPQLSLTCTPVLSLTPGTLSHSPTLSHTPALLHAHPSFLLHAPQCSLSHPNSLDSRKLQLSRWVVGQVLEYKLAVLPTQRLSHTQPQASASTLYPATRLYHVIYVPVRTYHMLPSFHTISVPLHTFTILTINSRVALDPFSLLLHKLFVHTRILSHCSCATSEV